jgi:hypothetical protein
MVKIQGIGLSATILLNPLMTRAWRRLRDYMEVGWRELSLSMML